MGFGSLHPIWLDRLAQIDKRDLFERQSSHDAAVPFGNWLQQSRDWLEKYDLPEEWKQSWSSINTMD